MGARRYLVRRQDLKRGEYDPAALYPTGSFVRYQGALWRSLRAVTGVTPIEGADWTLMVDRGATGPRGEVGPEGPRGERGLQGVDALGRTPLSTVGAKGLFSAALTLTGSMDSVTNPDRVAFADATTAANFAAGDPIVIEGAAKHGKDLWTRVSAYTAGNTYLTVQTAALSDVTAARVVKPQTGTMALGSTVISGLVDASLYAVGSQVMVEFAGSGTRAEVNRIEFRQNNLRQVDLDTFGNVYEIWLDRTPYPITLSVPSGQTTCTKQDMAQQTVDQVLVQQENMGVTSGEWAGSVVALGSGNYAAEFTGQFKAGRSHAKTDPVVFRNPWATSDNQAVTSGTVTAHTIITAKTHVQGHDENDLFGEVASVDAAAGTLTLSGVRYANPDAGTEGEWDGTSYPVTSSAKLLSNQTGPAQAVDATRKAMVLPDSTRAIKDAIASPGTYFVDAVPGGFGINMADGCYFTDNVSISGEGAGVSKFVRLGAIVTPRQAQSPFLRNLQLGSGVSNVSFRDFLIDGRYCPKNSVINIWEQESAALHVRATAGSLHYCERVNIVGVDVFDWPGPAVQMAQIRAGIIQNLRIRRCNRGGLVFFGDCDEVLIDSTESIDADDDAFAANAARTITGGSTRPYATRFQISNCHFRSLEPEAGQETNPAMSLRGSKDFYCSNIITENGYDASMTITPYFGQTNRNIFFDNLQCKNSLGPGIWFRASGTENVRLRGVMIEDCKGHGIHLDTINESGVSDTTCRDIEFEDVTIYRAGINWQSSSLPSISGMDGIHVSGPVALRGFAVRGVKAREASRSAIFMAQTALAEDVEISGVRVRNCNRNGGTTDAIRLENLAYFSATGLISSNDSGWTNKTRYGLYIHTSCDQGLVDGCVIPAARHVTGAIYQGPTTVTMGANRT